MKCEKPKIYKKKKYIYKKYTQVLRVVISADPEG